MGYQSQAGYLGLKIQTAKGVYADPGSESNPGVFFKTRSGSLGGERDFLIPDPEIGGTRDIQGAALGPIKFSGSYDLYARMESLATLVLAAFGQNEQKTTITVDATGGTYTITYAGQTTAAIAYNATAGAVQTALELLLNIAPGDIAVTGGVGASGGGVPYVITYLKTGTLDDTAGMTTTPTLTGGAATAVAVTTNKITTGTAATGYTHTITCKDVGSVPWVSAEERIADGYETFKYTDCKVNTLHLEADANGFLMGSAGIIGMTQALQSSPTAVSLQRWDTSPLMVGSNVTVQYGGATLPAKSFSLDFTNNIEDDDFRLGSLFLGDLVEKRRELTMGVTIRPQDSTLWRQAMWGSPAAVVPGGQTYTDDAVITISTYEDIPGADPGVKYQLVFTVPSAIIRPFTVEPSGDDVIEHDLEIQAVRPSPATPLVTVAIRNSYDKVA